jgi:hypothetical protein
MSDDGPDAPRHGAELHDRDGAVLGRVDAVFVDYVLVRTPGLFPIDLYIPVTELHAGEGGVHRVGVARREAARRWHRPLKRAPHPAG